MGMRPEYNEPAKVVSLPKKAAGFHDIHLMILDFVSGLLRQGLTSMSIQRLMLNT